MAQWTARDSRPVARKPVIDWRLRRSYGFGAGQIRLAPHPASFVSQPAPALASLGQLVAEWRELDWADSFWSALRPAVAVALAALLLLALAVEFRRPPVDFSDLQIIDFPATEAPVTTAKTQALAAYPAPGPREVESVAEPTPTISPRVPEAPLPAVPSMPELTNPIVLQAPVPVSRPEPVREAPRPAVHIEMLEALERPELPVAALATRTTRTAIERTQTATQSPVAIDPLVSRSARRPPRAMPSRPSLARPALTAKPGRAAVRVAPIALAGSPGDPPPPKSRRSTGTARPHSNPRRSSARPVALAAVGLAAHSTPTTAVASVSSSVRTVRSGTAIGGSLRGEVDATLAGVPLSALAACVSDREEDSLKLELLATVTHRTECSSASGRYRFVETKNLNAFLMWVERAPHRARADRCVELRHALDCLQPDMGYYGEST